MAKQLPLLSPKHAQLALLALVLAVVVSFGFFRHAERLPNTSTPARWRVLIYMAADNDLDAAAAVSLAELSQTMTTSAVQVAVQVDRSARRARASARAGVDTRRYRSRRGLLGGYRVEPEAELGPMDSGALGTLEDFLQWGKQAVSGDHTLLILWGHGRGDRGLLVDESTGSSLRPDEVGKALRGQGIDVLAMDACSMLTLGVAEAFRGTARYLVGSPSPRHVLGWPYAALLKELTEQPEKSPREVATWFSDHAGDRGEAFTGAALDLQEVDALSKTVAALSEAAQRLPEAEKARIAGTIRQLPTIAKDARTVDLDAALSALQAVLPDVVEKARKAQNDVVIAEVHSEDFADCRGIGVVRADVMGWVARGEW